MFFRLFWLEYDRRQWIEYITYRLQHCHQGFPRIKAWLYIIISSILQIIIIIIDNCGMTYQEVISCTVTNECTRTWCCSGGTRVTMVKCIQFCVFSESNTTRSYNPYSMRGHVPAVGRCAEARDLDCFSKPTVLIIQTNKLFLLIFYFNNIVRILL